MISIERIPLTQSGHLQRMFARALSEDFSYYSPSYRKEVVRNHSRARLSLGCVHPRRLYLGLYDDTKLQGYSMSGVSQRKSKGKKAFLYWFYIVPALRGQRLGRKMLEATESHLVTRGVDSLSLVTYDQQAFYTHHGYETTRKVPESNLQVFHMQKVLS